MHLLDAWTDLNPFDLARLLGLPAAVLLAALLPGRRVAMFASIATAVGVAALDELAVPALVRAGWVALWLVVAWQSGVSRLDVAAAPRFRRGAIESGAIALPLGLGLLALLLAGLSREAFSHPEARRATLGALLVCAGLLHLMMRRHVRRALVAFAALGLGLELLTATARAADVLHAGPPAGVSLTAALVLVALTRRVAEARERFAGSPAVGEAHELHD